MHVADTTQLASCIAQTDAAVDTGPEQKVLIGKTAVQLHPAQRSFSWLRHAIFCAWNAEDCSMIAPLYPYR